MAGTITTGNHPKALRPGVRKFVMGEYSEHPKEYSEVFDVMSSSMAYEEDVETTGFGLVPEKAEGAATSYDSHTQGFTKRYTHVAYSMGFIVTREEKDDNLYLKRAFKRGRMLAFSFRTTKEIVAANVLNRGFNSSYTGGDGKELFATDHPTQATDFSNELATPADLSEASLEDLTIQIMQATNSRGLEIAITPRKLIVPPALAYEAERILKSTLRVGTGNNDINAMRSMGVMPEGCVVNHYLTDADAWFIKTDAPDGLLMFERTGFEVSNDNDFDTTNDKFKGYERYSVGWTDPRGAFASAGA